MRFSFYYAAVLKIKYIMYKILLLTILTKSKIGFIAKKPI